MVEVVVGSNMLLLLFSVDREFTRLEVQVELGIGDAGKRRDQHVRLEGRRH